MNWRKNNRMASIFGIATILLIINALPVGAQLIEDGGGGTALKCGRSYEVRNNVTYSSGIGYSITTIDMVQYISYSDANALAYAYNEQIRVANILSVAAPAGVLGILTQFGLPSAAATTISGLAAAFYVYQLTGEVNKLNFYNAQGTCGLKIEQKYTYTFASSGTSSGYTIQMIRNVVSQQSTQN